MADTTTSTSFWASPVFHQNLRTWAIILGIVLVVGFIFVHESNSNAAQQALVKQVLDQGNAQKADIDKQISASQATTNQQIAVIAQQIQQVQTVAQAIASLKQTVPQITVTPIIPPGSNPSTVTGQKAAGDTPVATISGGDLKILSDNALECKSQGIQFSSCQQQVVLEQQKETILQGQVDELKKVKIVPAWKKTLTTIGHVALGIAIGKVI